MHELTILMPCLNEAETLAVCIKKASDFLRENNVDGEVLIADNGSTDGSIDIAKGLGARVVNVDQKGYGSALLGGTNAANSKYIIMGDADDSYDFSNLMPFVLKLREGFDLVMGNRFKGGVKPGAMPFLNRYLGNPVLSFAGRLFYNSNIGDFHCGLRGYNKESMLKIGLKTTGMEYASEMVVKATLYNLKIAEVPTTLSPDGRSRPPHLKPWRDGWRHLRFLLVFSPRWLFLYPGLFLMIVGTIILTLLLPGKLTLGGITFDIHTMFYASTAIIIGMQVLSFGLFTDVYTGMAGITPKDKLLEKTERLFSLERGLIVGLVFIILGLIGSVYAFLIWGKTSFGTLDPQHMMRLTIPSLTLLVLGIQTFFSSFFLDILLKKQ